MGLKNIRRCRNCNNKTHQNLWNYGKICPVCDEPAPYKESFHGGLSVEEIQQIKKELSIEPRDWGKGIER